MAMEIPIDYHILFLAMIFVLLIITIFLLFVDAELEKTVGAFILIMINVVFCLIAAFMFTAIDLYGYDTTGAIVHNVYSGMHYLSMLYVILMYVNFMLLVYCGYLFIRKPWERVMGDEEETFYHGPPY